MPIQLLDMIDDASRAFELGWAPGATGVVGFDGFVDEMASVVQTRRPDGSVETVPTIAAFGQLVLDAADRSFGREVAVKRVEAGGNAPNLAEGLMSLGMSVDFCGTLGDPIDPVFEPFSRRCRSCTTLGACGRTLALEFGDGKLMLNNTGRLGELDERVFRRMLDDGVFATRCADAALIGLANWSRYPHMTACWRVLTDRVLSRLAHRPWLVVDLADPAGRTPGDIREMLEVVKRMAATCRVVFGANLHESGVVLGAIGENAPSGDAPSMEQGAARLRERLGISMAVVHSQQRAAGAWDIQGARGTMSIEGAYNPNPVRTTGVGDRFNAGLAAALVAGVTPVEALGVACAAGAWFVTVGRPLERTDFHALRGVLSR
jgi:sugar/nucleoside kinase (ribokinase family)